MSPINESLRKICVYLFYIVNIFNLIKQHYVFTYIIPKKRNLNCSIVILNASYTIAINLLSELNIFKALY